MKRVLITGGKGMLGHVLANLLKKEYEVMAPGKEELDVTRFEGVSTIMASFQPHLVIHTAAFTDVDGCQLRPERAYQVNALGTQNVSLTCQKEDSILIYLSSDYVFDGKRREPYLEFDPVSPPNVYGKSKYAGEQFVTALLKRYFIVRSSWLFGLKGKNFVETILKAATREKLLKVVDDQIGSPTYTADLAGGIKSLMETPFFGVYHMTNQGVCSWYQYAREILEVAGITNVEVLPINSAELGRAAPRPPRSVLDNFCSRMRGLPPFRHYREALKEYISHLQPVR